MKKLVKRKTEPTNSWVDQVETLYAAILVKPNDPEAYLKLTALLEEHNRFVEALELYSQGLRQIPGHGLLQMNYGLLLYKLGEIDSAKILMASARDLLTSPDPTEVKIIKALAALGKSQIQTSQFKSARKTYEELLRLAPDNSKNLFVLASLLQRMQDYDQACDYFQRVIELETFKSQPELVSKAYQHLSTAATKTERAPGTLEAYLTEMQLNPQISWHFFQFTRLLEDAESPEEALDRYRAFIAVNPDDPKLPLILCRLGVLLQMQGAIDDAKTHFLKALDQDPKCLWALYLLGFLFADQAEPEQVFHWFEKIIPLHEEAAFLGFEPAPQFQTVLAALETEQEQHKSKPEYLAVLGQIQLQAGQFESASKTYTTLLETDPEHPQHFCRLASALQGLGDAEKAREYYHQILARETFEENPKLISVVYKNLALLASKQDLDQSMAKTYAQAQEVNPRLNPYFFHLTRLLEDAMPDAVIARYQAFIEANPQDPDRTLILCHLGQSLRKQRCFDEARELFLQAMDEDPSCLMAYFQLAFLENDSEMYDESIYWIKQAQKYDPDVGVVGYRLFNALALLPNPPEIQAKFKTFREANEAALHALSSKAHPLREVGNFGKIASEYSLFLKRHPTQIEAICAKARALSQQRKNQEAYALLLPIVEAGYLHSDVADVYATACLHTKRFEESRVYLDQVLACKEVIFFYRRKILFTLGQMYDKAKQPDKAFPYFIEANTLKSQSWNPQKQEDRTSILMQIFNRETFPNLPKGSYSARPVFVVGMPRSGTTLTEQILCSHPDIFGAGEIGSLFQAFNKLIGKQNTHQWHSNRTNPHFVQNFTAKINTKLLNTPLARWAEVAQDYLSHMDGLADRKGYSLIVNKMPGNFLYLGLIQVLFPNAIVIHCRRHPLDTCLSCFSIDFKDLKFTNNMETLGRYYQQYQRIMAHWKAHLDIPILEVPYEETIADQEAMSRRLIAYCGLEWDERCLKFFKTDRHVKTASYEQVRKPIYTSSVARYKPYESYLAPLKQWIDLEEWAAL